MHACWWKNDWAKGAGRTPDAIEIPLSESSEQVLEIDWKSAQSFQQSTVGSEHILIGLLDSGLSDFLQQLGADPEAVRGECVGICKDFQLGKPVTADQISLDRESRQRREIRNAVNNILKYSERQRDALKLITTIVGMVLQASRCLIVCEIKPGQDFECYEWHQDKVERCKNSLWPWKESRLISFTMQSSAPYVYLNAVDASVDPDLVQELQIIQAKAFLGLALRAGEQVFGSLVLHRCEASGVWDDGDIRFAREIADQVTNKFAKMGQ